MCDDKKNVAAAAVVGVAAGVVAGYIVGILTAPKSGTATRKDIKEATDRVAEVTHRRLNALQAQVVELIEQARSRAKNFTDRSKQDLNELIEDAQEAQEKANEVLVAIKEGEAEDPDLRLAVEKAGEAKNNLANFLKKN